MLKWVVTRGSHVAFDDRHPSELPFWDCDKENCHTCQLFNEANNNNHVQSKSVTTKKCIEATSSSAEPVGSKRTSLDALDAACLSSHSSFAANNTLSSFRYFLVNEHSSPLKRIKRPVEESVSSIFTTTPLVSRGHCTSPRFSPTNRRTKHQRPRPRLSSLHIREPTELASPSYRPADDPANDLSNDCTTPVRTTGTEDVTRCCKIWDMIPIETIHYNEREIKSPEAKKQHSNLLEGDRLVRQKAVRRRKQAKHTVKNELSNVYAKRKPVELSIV